jgi:hypothetical protein
MHGQAPFFLEAKPRIRSPNLSLLQGISSKFS